MASLIPRGEAGLSTRTGIALYTRTPAQTSEFMVHFDGGETPKTAQRSLELLRGYDRYHAGKGWGGIGYNLAVCPVTGKVYEARGLDRVGAHTQGHNTSGVGVILIGGEGNLTTAGKQGLQDAYDIASAWAGKTLTVHGHKDFADTSCPGTATYQWLKDGGIKTVSTTKPTTYVDGRLVAAGTAAAFQKLAAAFKKATGLTLHVRDGLRTYEQQKDLYDRWTGKKKPPFYAPSVAYPGTSRHETGRALDIYDSGNSPGVTVAGNVRSNWIRKNASTYGFSAIGYTFNEPWHIEYQGDPWAGSGAAAGVFSQEYIKDIQSRLVRLGYNIGASGIDGSKGPATTAAIKAFQKSVGITEDGLPGPTTLGKVKIVEIQRAVNATRDGSAGPDTKKRVDAVRQASRYGGGKFPYGVKYAQQVVGTKDDGAWGPNSVKAHDVAVERIQRAVGVTPDKQFGPATDKAVKAVIGS